MPMHETHTNEVKLLGEKLKGIKIAMLTTLEADGSLRSRPMATLDMDFDGTLWFFTQANASKVNEVRQHHQINLAYAKPEDSVFTSVSGTAELVRDQQRINEYWKPFLKAWFPNGKDDPELALLKVTVTSAEYWDAPSSKMVNLFNMARAAVTGNADTLGENKKIDVR